MRNREADGHVQAVLTGIANRARVSKRHRFGGVYSLLNEELLRWSFYNLNKKAAPGVDGVTWLEASACIRHVKLLHENCLCRKWRP